MTGVVLSGFVFVFEGNLKIDDLTILENVDTASLLGDGFRGSGLIESVFVSKSCSGTEGGYPRGVAGGSGGVGRCVSGFSLESTWTLSEEGSERRSWVCVPGIDC